jgi:hypothetical protein
VFRQCGDDPGICSYRRFAADAFDLFLLDGAEQFGLEFDTSFNSSFVYL